MSSIKITSKKDPNFSSKQKLMQNDNDQDRTNIRDFQSEKKFVPAMSKTRSEIKSSKKFGDRMDQSREASGEKFIQQQERFPSALKSITKSVYQSKSKNELVEADQKEECSIIIESKEGDNTLSVIKDVKEDEISKEKCEVKSEEKIEENTQEKSASGSKPEVEVKEEKPEAGLRNEVSPGIF